LNGDNARMQKYNKLLKLSYVRTFRKSWSFVVKLLQPLSLFFLSVFQLIFCLEHESVLFLILLCCIMSGFFVELKDLNGQNAYALLCKVILCIECLYVLVQYALNIYKVEGLLEAEKREELNIVLGIGNYQQLGYNEEDVPI
jgi:ABC-type enterochelin transport system permease subunit